jgi:flagellar hook-associated protein 3 FlgL
MSGIVPIPTTRVGDFFVRQQLVGQIQSDQLDLFQLENEVSTGKRLQVPSDDPPAALRAIDLQRAIQQKTQVQTNVQSSTSALNNADSALSNVADQLNSIHAAALGVDSTLSTDSARQAVIQQINDALKSLVNLGNSNYKGSYQFAGSLTNSQPYEYSGDYVRYAGNGKALNNFVDSNYLLATNVPGTDVFGGTSGEVKGSVNLNPSLISGTLVSAINGGSGISPNAAISLTVTSGSTSKTSVVDLSGATTIGDVARLIESSAPSGSQLTVEVSNNGLVITAAAGSTVQVGEVAAGKTAHELGIFTPTSATPSQTITGSDLDPAVLKTTPLENLLGTTAQGRITSGGANNDLVISATQNGASYNGTTVTFANDGTAGNETASYDSSTNTLTVHIKSGTSTANQVAVAINRDLAGTFAAQADYRDATTPSLAGSGTVTAGTFNGVTSGGSGQTLDQAHGLILTNGGKSVTLDISQARTVEDLTNVINGAGLNFQAQINDEKTGINVQSRLSGADFTIGENGGTTATQLGIRTYNGTTNLADLNRGVGVPTTDTFEQLDPSKLDNLSIVARDGTTLSVSLAGATTLQGVADKINAAVGNNTGSTAVLAQLSAGGNRIQLVDSSTSPVGPLSVQTVAGSQAAEYLGFISTGQTQSSTSAADSSGNYVLNSDNVVSNDLAITAADGKKLWVDLGGTKTVQDVIDRINSNPANNTGTTHVTAKLATTGNGIELVDSSTGSGALSVSSVEGSQAAQYLGFVASGATSSDPSSVTVDGSGHQVLTSEDRNTQHVDSVFNSLLRLKSALQSGDVNAIGREVGSIDTDLTRLSFSRAQIGSRLQSLGVLNTRLQDEHTQLQSALSDQTDVDLVQAISDLTARQFALQGSLKATANILQLSILNFL